MPGAEPWASLLNSRKSSLVGVVVCVECFTLWNEQADCFCLDCMMRIGVRSRADGNCGWRWLNRMTFLNEVTWLEGTRWDNDILTAPLKETMKCSWVFL